MELRRYYPRGYKGKTHSDELIARCESKGIDTSRFDTAQREIVLSPSEQKEWFDRSLQMVLDNPRAVLDNLDRMPTFRVAQKNVREPKAL
jgi:hypothetical protein